MSESSHCRLTAKHCVPCEGGVPKIELSSANAMLKEIPGWELSSDGNLLRRSWTVKNFVAGMEFLNQVADIAEQEQHHPDVHLTGYRNVKIELTTHAISGLSENDFILAAKINELPVKLKK